MLLNIMKEQRQHFTCTKTTFALYKEDIGIGIYSVLYSISENANIS